MNVRKNDRCSCCCNNPQTAWIFGDRPTRGNLCDGLERFKYPHLLVYFLPNDIIFCCSFSPKKRQLHWTNQNQSSKDAWTSNGRASLY